MTMMPVLMYGCEAWVVRKPTSMSINVDGLHCSMGGKSHMPLSMRTMGPNGWLELVAFADLGSVLFSLCLH